MYEPICKILNLSTVLYNLETKNREKYPGFFNIKIDENIFDNITIFYMYILCLKYELNLKINPNDNDLLFALTAKDKYFKYRIPISAKFTFNINNDPLFRDIIQFIDVNIKEMKNIEEYLNTPEYAIKKSDFYNPNI